MMIVGLFQGCTDVYQPWERTSLTKQKPYHCKDKVKGEKHSSSKVKKLASVDVEKLNSIKDFVDYAVTESRLEQVKNPWFP